MSYGDDTIYLDHVATKPVDPAVYESTVPYLVRFFGNPSSIYGNGQAARAALDGARGKVARVLSIASHRKLSSPAAPQRAMGRHCVVSRGRSAVRSPKGDAARHNDGRRASCGTP